MISTPLALDAIPSAGALFGTVGRRNVMDAINNALGSSGFFGSAADIFAPYRSAFMSDIVSPLLRVSEAARNLVVAMVNPDEYRPLVTEADFAAIPPIMQMPIIMYEPLKRLLMDGKIEGFGYNPAWLPEEDVYGRLINNCRCDDIGAALVASGDNRYDWHGTYWSTDPRLSEDELEAIEETRDFIDRVLATEDYDPTNYPFARG